MDAVVFRGVMMGTAMFAYPLVWGFPNFHDPGAFLMAKLF